MEITRKDHHHWQGHGYADSYFRFKRLTSLTDGATTVLISTVGDADVVPKHFGEHKFETKAYIEYNGFPEVNCLLIDKWCGVEEGSQVNHITLQTADEYHEKNVDNIKSKWEMAIKNDEKFPITYNVQNNGVRKDMTTEENKILSEVLSIIYDCLTHVGSASATANHLVETSYERHIGLSYLIGNTQNRCVELIKQLKATNKDNNV